MVFFFQKNCQKNFSGNYFVIFLQFFSKFDSIELIVAFLLLLERFVGHRVFKDRFSFLFRFYYIWQKLNYSIFYCLIFLVQNFSIIAFNLVFKILLNTLISIAAVSLSAAIIYAFSFFSLTVSTDWISNPFPHFCFGNANIFTKNDTKFCNFFQV